MDIAAFSQRLNVLRMEKGLRREDMARLLGVTTNHYQRIEYGKVNGSVSTLDFLAGYFGVAGDYLLGRED